MKSTTNAKPVEKVDKNGQPRKNKIYKITEYLRCANWAPHVTATNWGHYDTQSYTNLHAHRSNNNYIYGTYSTCCYL